MKETKRQFNNFQIMEFEKIEKHLKKMAEKGWMLESIEGILWKYKKIEPKSLHFSVAFFPKAKAFEPGPSEEQQMMWEFCEKTGWILAAQNMQLQIFYNEAENPVPIETDATIQVENIHKTAKSNVLSTWGTHHRMGTHLALHHGGSRHLVPIHPQHTHNHMIFAPMADAYRYCHQN